MGSVKSPFPFPLFFPGKIQENVTDSNCNDNDGGDGEIIQVFALIESKTIFHTWWGEWPKNGNAGYC